ncbi:HAD-IC family P-type ATPase [Pseudolactococcus carnosus]|uniref:HAD-IC family P-type ATPase n=1 Tax=Pseudolactococcus carnosus TaxID=2749961 RepID=UPI0008125F33|nr:HAD-IC family P-type ATPase [Lactococcus carnosus]SCA92527.1 Cation-transporting ATPase pma1 [Lactococcus piscium]MCJ1969470.1 HAD-IC family P-type ATPase [Lactococcus carnosus]MCJ1973986.1 HAD-IC family P-type ATPase [Lactococcus carnosus]MCJ1975432.1 HAD-IC family P-type ATPase [Lactococcus carnosus]MCJ1979106.1 HAD-IC family P-type ATPase [Lactococcus carnosus]
MKWYQLTKEAILSKLQTTDKGIQDIERQQRLESNGFNKIEEKQALKPWQKFLKHFTDLLMIVLLFASILKMITGDYVESAIIFLVVIINGLVGYWQERKAQDSLDGLKQMMGQEAVVLSDGVKATIPNETVVMGDIVSLNAGDVVPADLRLIDVHDLIIEESILTGESEPVEKYAHLIEAESAIGDQTNMAFSGTLVQSGSALGIVVATGSDTEIGKINQALQSIQQQTTPLVKKMNDLNQQLFKGIMVLIVFLIFFSTFKYGMDFNLLFSAMIALIVAMVPEGLPAVLTMILSAGVKEMAEEQAIIKSMPSVETLGSMTVICSDKTGTLTKNEMTVVDVIEAEKHSGHLFDIMNNCQELKLDDKQTIDDLQGNPTELALLHYVEKAGLTLKKVKAKIPFNSSYKYMATVHPYGQQDIIYVKGAPEVLMSLANLDKRDLSDWQQKAVELAQKGQRVLGFAYKEVDPQADIRHDMLTDLTFAGLAGIIDPPKESAIQAVEACQQAGISVKMITGDHKETAKAIGEQIGLTHTAEVLEGLAIDLMSDDALREAVKHVDVFARTTPEHKLRIVTALQSNGEIVGMTGDGVNDAPALKKADIGIAMGIKGSEVSKQAADMVLADDNFQTISKAVKEGRRIFDNLKKTINFFIPTALAQGFVVIFALLMNRPLPLSPVQILWVNMVTTIALSYALGFEKASADTMSRPPRPTNEGILSAYSLFRIFYVSLLIMIPSYFLSTQYDGVLVQQTVLLQSIVFAQAVYMINCRELLNPSINKAMFQNRALFISLGILTLLQLGLQFSPLAHTLIGTAQLTLTQISAMLLNALIIFIIVEVEKMITKKITVSKT